ncbi:MAG TPA: penicillin-binding transpeptidase domain-containing protein, partial [Candidatus Solibacter sp.]
MRLSCALIFSFALAGTGAASAAALDAPHTIHRTRPQHLVESHHTRHAAAHATAKGPAKAAAHNAAPKASAKTAVVRTTRHSAKVGSGAASIRRASLHGRHHYYGERFTASSFAGSDEFAGDVTTGEDPIVRQAAVDALGDMNGTAVVIDPSNGRILAMVNQKLALSPGAEPCSTIKITVAMAALSEGIVTRDTMVQLPGFRMNMTQALAKSNNLYFEELGRELGFERVKHYANEFGLGELAGWQVPGEQLGTYPEEAIPVSEGGVGKMCSFGQGVSMTPLQLGAYVAALANGGTLYYLQHPTTPADIAAFEPRVKRTLDIARFVPELQDGMAGAVEYGTARRL